MTNLKIIVADSNPALHDAIRAVSDRIEIVSPQQVKEQPDLLAQIDAAFGGLSVQQIAEAERLRWFQSAGAGVNSLLTPAIRARGELVITNASGIHAEPITEHMFGMLLMVTRRLDEAREQQKRRQWRGGYSFGANVSLLAGKTLGVLGIGAIGGHSAHVGRAFGMRVVGLRKSQSPHPDVERLYTPPERLAFFAECDVVMNSLPLTDNTRGFMGEPEFAALKTGAIVINTGRGATIDTNALVAAVQSERLGAALLDVTDPEPLPTDHPLWTLPNVFITPHYSGAHPTYNERAGRIFLDNLRRFVAGEPLTNVVDKQEGY